ncbi:MAG: rhodanese-like domain-containing protein [Proteobacteria bacterium]|nr:rhodanese-like domain-containing protein [Pseudomonadota bacterium]
MRAQNKLSKSLFRLIAFGIIIQLITMALSYGIYQGLPKIGIGGREPLEINGILALSLQPFFFTTTYLGEILQINFLSSVITRYISFALQVALWGVLVEKLWIRKSAAKTKLIVICTLGAIWCLIILFPVINTANEENATEKLLDDISSGGYGTVTGEELNQWIQNKSDITTIDTRKEKDFLKGHIPRAVNCPFPDDEGSDQSDYTQKIDQAMSGEKSRSVVFYGYGEMGLRSEHLAAVYLVNKGYTHVYRFLDGMRYWTMEEYPLEYSQ